ncbi:hypothetical protein QR680_002433 [Steinernema hermaphroditum]|uniref:Centromere protein X n=1 Tax=Steinernema hermaphroditum TaxID=289476 RepID=A0AA39H4U4_9BILA|nr:hypothetical protein QR680_002433 [Steinernema hermaphroditum]
MNPTSRTSDNMIEELLNLHRSTNDFPRTTAKAQEMLAKAAEVLIQEAFRRAGECALKTGETHVTKEHFYKILYELILDFCV